MRVKSLFAVFLVLICTAVYTLKTSGETVCFIEDCEELIGVYNYCGNDFLALYVGSGSYHYAVTDGENADIYDTEMSADTNAVSFVGGYLYFFENTLSGDTPAVKVCRLECGNNTKRYSIVNTDIQILQGRCAADGDGNYYFIDGEDIRIIRDNTPAERVYVGNAPRTVVSSCEGERVYCTTARELAVIENGEAFYIPVQADRVYPSADTFSDDVGTVYANDGSVLYGGFSGSHGGIGTNGAYFGIKDGRLVQVYKGKETAICDMDESAFLCMGSDRFVAVLQNGGTAEVRSFDNQPTEPAVSSGIGDSEDKKSTFNLDGFCVKGDYLCGIAPETTAAQMKKMFSPENCTVQFLNTKNEEIKSGNVGTGCTVMIKAESEYSYIIIVYGDLSGDGSVKTTDRRSLMKHFLAGDNLSYAQHEAADINHDGNVDLKDVTALNLYLNGEEDISQSLK